jgi:CheY-like chemotaxis protein
MKSWFLVTIICTVIILACCISTSSAEPAQYDKRVSIYLTVDNGGMRVTDTRIAYGTSANLLPMQQGFNAELVAADGTVKKTFPVWDPRIQIGDSLVEGDEGLRLVGAGERRNSADFVVSFPYDPKVTLFRLTDPARGTVLTSVDLQPRISEFFQLYPLDPDNPAIDKSDGAAPAGLPGTEIPEPAAPTPGQILGLQAMGAGAVLLLGGAFASVRFLQKKTPTVLVVDDNPDIVVVISSMLQKGGYRTRTATGGQACLADLKAHVPDLILLDIGMEPMDGWDTLRRIKKDPATKKIPVIMLTAHTLIPRDVLDYGVCIEDYLVKPVTLQNLTDAIMHVFARKQLIEEKIAAAKEAGIGQDELCECARLTRVVDVNKRLWDILASTYNREEGMMQGAGDETTRAIRNIEGTFRDQEQRLHQIRQSFGQTIKP